MSNRHKMWIPSAGCYWAGAKWCRTPLGQKSMGAWRGIWAFGVHVKSPKLASVGLLRLIEQCLNG
jgi:hypothetical protein